MKPSPAAEQAGRLVVAVHENPDQRLKLAASGYPDHLSAYGQSELRFLRWELARGVLHPTSGSGWWRAVNNRLLRDKLEARMLTQIVKAVEPDSDAAHVSVASTPGAQLWLDFLHSPSPITWYRAHNRSIVSGYLENDHLAAAESPPERFMINVMLARVLLTHTLIERPALTLGRFARLGPRIANPRSSSVGLFLDLHNVFPLRYPVQENTIQEVIALEGRVARVIDYGLMLPRLAAIYEFAATCLGEPRLETLIANGTFTYGGPTVAPHELQPDRLSRLVTAALGTAAAPRP